MRAKYGCGGRSPQAANQRIAAPVRIIDSCHSVGQLVGAVVSTVVSVTELGRGVGMRWSEACPC